LGRGSGLGTGQHPGFVLSRSKIDSSWLLPFSAFFCYRIDESKWKKCRKWPDLQKNICFFTWVVLGFVSIQWNQQKYPGSWVGSGTDLSSGRHWVKKSSLEWM